MCLYFQSQTPGVVASEASNSRLVLIIFFEGPAMSNNDMHFWCSQYIPVSTILLNKHVTVESWSIFKMQTCEKQLKASKVFFSRNYMWFLCSQNIPVAAMLCSIALINPVFQNIPLYFIKGSTQIHSNFDPILSLNTMKQTDTLFWRSWFECNLHRPVQIDSDSQIHSDLIPQF